MRGRDGANAAAGCHARCPGRSRDRTSHRRAPRAAGAGPFESLSQRAVAGEVQIHVDRTFGLDEVAEALARVGEGQALGKVVVVPR
nr:zinc-binding dehydrogenase [Ornithinimicrobium sp. HY1793]